MASTGKTTNLNLNQWAADDPVLRTDFNADNLILDAHTHDGRYYTETETDALLAGKASVKTGTFTGPLTPNTTTKNTLSADFVPRVEIEQAKFSKPIIMLRPLTTAYRGDSESYVVEWGEKSVTWYSSTASGGSNTNHSYIMFG